MFRRVLTLLVFPLIVSACGKDTPTAPTPQTPTRIISITGSLAFGEVDLGATAERTARISNAGTEALTVTGMSGPSGFSASWTNGSIPPGGGQDVTFRFSPTERRDYVGAVVVAANHTSGNNRIDINGTGRQIGPRTRFGAGQYQVGSDIASGRYFTAPTNGCYWERQSGFGGSFGEIIANDFVGYTATQYIVDVLSSDRGFETDAQCGTWDQSPRRGLDANISTGVWLIGAQIAPGTYRTDAPAGCYWERLRNFEHQIRSILDNEFVSGGGQQIVTIRPDDVGFQSDDCGTWTPIGGVSSLSSTSSASVSDIQQHRDAWRQSKGQRR